MNIVKYEDGRITITHVDNFSRIRIPNTQAELSSQREMDQYVGFKKRPEVCAAIQLVAPGNNTSTPADYKSFAKTTKFLQQTKQQGIYFVPLDLTSVLLSLITYASFANSENARSQLGYVVLMVDKTDRANFVYYG